MLRFVLAALIGENLFRHTVFLDAPAQTVLNFIFSLSHVEPCADNVPFGIIDPCDEVNLLLAAVPGSDKRTVFHIALPKLIAVLLLKAPGGSAFGHIHPHLR
jgi:hypothetical protein